MGYNFDDSIAEHYAPQLLRPLKFGENGVFFWIPGSGMTSIVNNLFSSEKLLKKYLPYSKLLETLYFWGQLSDKKNSQDLLRSGGFSDYPSLEEKCLKLIEEGKEVVCIIGRIDDYSNTERIAILKNFVRLTSKNRHRIHILFYSFDKPWFEERISKHPEFIILANHMEIVPILSGEILKKYILGVSEKFEYKISESKVQEIAKTYGGIIQLTKQYIRSFGNIMLLETKLRVNWNDFPKSYKVEIQRNLLERSNRNEASSFRDLQTFGVSKLKIFTKHRSILNLNPEFALDKLLTLAERNLWLYMKAHPRHLLLKEKVTDILRPENNDGVSLWAADQAISRFRKKLDRAGIDSDLLMTVKGKGYIWKG